MAGVLQPMPLLISVMKNLLLFAFCIVDLFCNAQSTGKDIQVEYRMYCNTDVPVMFNNTLHVSGNIAIYHQKTSTLERWTEKPSEYEMKMDKLKDDYEPYLKIDNKKKELLFYDVIGKNVFMVKDNYNNLKWDISGEKKTIAGYECVKATASYRGREWIVWFSPDIPLPFGPWKLHGLPGLILEATDATERYAFKAVKIENIRSEIFDKEFNKLIATKNSTPIPIVKFLQDKDEYDENRMRELMGGDPNIKFEIRNEARNGEELKYEWEK